MGLQGPLLFPWLSCQLFSSLVKFHWHQNILSSSSWSQLMIAAKSILILLFSAGGWLFSSFHTHSSLLGLRNSCSSGHQGGTPDVTPHTHSDLHSRSTGQRAGVGSVWTAIAQGLGGTGSRSLCLALKSLTHNNTAYGPPCTWNHHYVTAQCKLRNRCYTVLLRE